MSAKQRSDGRFPYEHQRKAMECLDIIDKLDDYSTLIMRPTGGERTYIASSWLLKPTLNKHKKILWIAHRQMILDQAAESFQKFAYAESMPNVSNFRYRIVSEAAVHDRTIDIVSSDNLLVASKDSLGRNMHPSIPIKEIAVFLIFWRSSFFLMAACRSLEDCGSFFS